MGPFYMELNETIAQAVFVEIIDVFLSLFEFSVF